MSVTGGGGVERTRVTADRLLTYRAHDRVDRSLNYTVTMLTNSLDPRALISAFDMHQPEGTYFAAKD